MEVEITIKNRKCLLLCLILSSHKLRKLRKQIETKRQVFMATLLPRDLNEVSRVKARAPQVQILREVEITREEVLKWNLNLLALDLILVTFTI